jgi:nitrate/nitrite-specific signal transduction histidine kinase
MLKIYKKIFLIFITQLFKTFLVSFLIFLAIQKLLTQHMVHIGQYLKTLNINSLNDELVLRRIRPNKKVENEDELDTLVYSINQMRTKLKATYHELSHLNRDLEDKVIQKKWREYSN